MEWLLILALGVWTWRQGRTLAQVRRKLDQTADALARLAPPAAQPAAQKAVAETAPVAPPPAELAQGLPPYRQPRDDAPRPARVPPAAEPPPVVAAPPAPEPDPEPEAAPEVVPAPEPGFLAIAPTPPARPLVNREAVSTWLAENGLAWIGGGGLALGGLLLVAYAAQRGVFTPPLRIAAAVVLGALMVAASEWILRRRPEAGGRHTLAAAVAAGAGAVTLYGAVCAAHGLYHLIPFGLAAVLAGAVSLGLLALSLRHGEPLALVAVVGAVLTPIVTDPTAWSPLAFGGYAALIGVTGFSIAAVRGWGKTALAAAAGLILLSARPGLDGRLVETALLQALAAVGPLAALWRRLRTDADPGRPVSELRQGAIGAVVLACLAGLGLWATSAPLSNLPIAAVHAAFLVVLVAGAVALGLAPSRLFVAPVGAAVLAVLVTLAVHGREPGLAARLPWIWSLAALIPLATLGAALRLPSRQRGEALAVGGVATAVIASLAWPLLHAAHLPYGCTPAAALGLAMLGLAAVIAARVEDPSRDPGLGFWLGAAVEMTFLGLHGASDPRFEPAVFGLAALALAAASRRLPWRGLAQGGVIGGALALAVMLRGEFVGAALAGRLALPLMAGVSAAAALLVFAAGRVLRRGDPGRRGEGEALETAALLIGLLALFTGLHVLLAGGVERGSVLLLEAALRTLLLLATGLVLVVRQQPDDGPVARWRTLLVMAAGLAHGLLLQGLALNPWWGLGEAPAGPPLVNTLALSFLAPAALLAGAAWRRRPSTGAADDAGRGWTVGAALFGLLWTILAWRHGFHGAAMDQAPIVRAELAGYAILGLLAACLFAHPRLERLPTAGWLTRAAPAFGWTAIAFAALVLGLLANPWWGPGVQPLRPWDAALLLALYAAGVVLLVMIARRDDSLGRGALVGAAALAFLLAVLLIRYAFHGAGMATAACRHPEIAAYAVLALLTARAFADPRLARLRASAWLAAAAPTVGWTALAWAILAFGLWASPWWGTLQRPLAPLGSALLLLALYGAGAGLLVELGRSAERFGRVALAIAVATLFALVSLLVRYGFHGPAMGLDAPGGGLETWTFSAVWAVFGLCVLSLGSTRRDVVLRWAGLAVLLATAAKLLLFDLARLEGVVRAASFLAVGALLLGGAVLVRRLNARGRTAPPAAGEEV